MAGHTTVAAAVPSCQTCHETAPYQGMIASSASAAGDSRPTAFDHGHPTAGDCSGCHTTTPTFTTNVTAAGKAGEPHTDERGLHAVSHHGRQLRALFGDRHAPGSDVLRDLPRAERRNDVRECDHHDHDGESHPDRHPRLQWLRMSYGGERQSRRLQHWRSQHQQPDVERRRTHDGCGRRAQLSDLPPDGALPGNDRQHCDRPPAIRGRPALWMLLTRPRETAGTATSRRRRSQVMS